MTEPDTPCWNAESGWLGNPLDTARLRLRRPEPRDAAAIAELASDWEVARWTAELPHPYTLDDAHAFVAAQGGPVVMSIERRLDGALVGIVGLGHHWGENEIGYWIGRRFWGHGYGTEALRRVARLAFHNFNLPHLRAEILTDNTGSRRVLEKLGFTLVGSIERELPARGTRARLDRWILQRDVWEGAEAAKPMLLVAAVAMLDVDGRVLIAQRPEGKMMSGFWEFPGGKVDRGETPEAALVRELDEELGVDIRESCLAPLAFASHDYDTFHLLMPLYVCRTWKGQVTAREGQKLAWVRPARLGDYPMPPADIPLVAILRDWA